MPTKLNPTHMREGRTQSLTVETGKTKLMFESNITRTVMKRISAAATDLSKAVQIC